MDDQGYPQSRQRRLARLPAWACFATGAWRFCSHSSFLQRISFVRYCSLCTAPHAINLRGCARVLCIGLSGCFSGCWLSVTTRQYRTACFLCPAINAKSRSLSTCFLRFYSCVLTAQPCLIPQPDKKQFCLGWPAHRWGMQKVPASTDQVMRQSSTPS